jgi:hypothetical protein
MARGRGIKQEPQEPYHGSTVPDSVDVIPGTRSPAVDEAGKALNMKPQRGEVPARARSTTMVPLPAPSERRGARSMARKYLNYTICYTRIS